MPFSLGVNRLVDNEVLSIIQPIADVFGFNATTKSANTYFILRRVVSEG